MIPRLLLLLFFGLKSGDKLTVRTLHDWVMQQPSFIGASVGAVSRGDGLVFVEEQGSWYKVRTGTGAEGWMHRDSVIAAQVNLASLTVHEIDAEQAYRAEDPDLEWHHVDAIGVMWVTPEELEEFKKAGTE